MPFNFPDFAVYQLNYSKILNYLTNIDLLENPINQKAYIEYWMKILKKSDEILTKEVNTPDKIKFFNVNAIRNNELEVFQQSILYGDVELLIHFRISAFKKILKSTPDFTPFKIPLSELTARNSSYKWNPVKTSSKHPINTDPVLIIPFLQGQYNFLIIDGNHRISSAIQTNKKEIDALILSESSVLDLDILSSGFDKYLYVFNNELNHIANRRHQQQFTDLELLNMSYLKNHKFNFH